MSINSEVLHSIDQLLTNYQNTELLVVTKNRSETIVNDLISRGYKLFGENRVQEAKQKFQKLNMNKIKLHLIGPLQSNKVQDALKMFDVIQTLDRYKLVDEIYKNIPKINEIKTKEFYIQINIGDELQKSGINSDELKKFYDYCLFKSLNIIGLMCIPPINKDPSSYFSKMSSLRNSINPELKLSMGMSSDYENAIKLGSNLIRVGSKIFN